MAQRQRPPDRSRPDRGRDLIRRPGTKARVEGLRGLLADLNHLSEGCETVTLGQLLDTIGARGHGPIIVTLSGLMMLPTGMIPMMPAAIGIFLGLTGVQMIVGGKGVSLPRRVGPGIDIGAVRMQGALRRAAPVSNWLGRAMHPRWSILVTSALSLNAIAVLLLVSGAIMVVIGSIPGLPFVFSIPVLIFGLGLTAGDGLVVALGYLATLAAAGTSIVLVPQAVAFLFGG